MTFIDNSKHKIIGYFTEIQYRFYLLSSSDLSFLNYNNEGFYASPTLKYRYKKIESGVYVDKINTVGMNLILGFKYSFIERISLDINLGGSIQVSDIQIERTVYTYKNNIFSEGYTGILPVGNITIGIRF